ncbi:hypothetical protein J6590_065899 [Homalodisca vitripennis]|nr:hypothetical protein J6590_065899 [Homalodisca vitripennis]
MSRYFKTIRSPKPIASQLYSSWACRAGHLSPPWAVGQLPRLSSLVPGTMDCLLYLPCSQEVNDLIEYW